MAQSKVLTIDIGSENIKIMEVSSAGKNNSYVHSMILTNTPDSSYEDGFLRDKNRIAKAIREGLDENGVDNKFVIFTLASTKIINREVVIPDCKEKKLKAIVLANVSEYFPVNISEYVITYTILEKFETEDGKQQKILVIAAPQGIIKSYYELAALMNMQLIDLDYAGNSIMQVFQNDAAEGISLIVQLGAQTTGIQIIKNGIVQLQRSMTYGTSEVVASIIDKFGLSSEEAIEMIRNKSLLVAEEEDADEDVIASMSMIVNGINRIMDYFQARNQDMTVDRIFLIGGGALICNIDKFFEHQFGIPAEVKSRFQNVIMDKRIDPDKADTVMFIANIGASIKPVGFISEEANQANKESNAMRMYIYFVALSVAASITLVALPFVQMNVVKGKIKKLNSGINELTYTEQFVNDRNAANAERDIYTSAFNATTTVNERTADVILELEKKWPVGIKMQTINFQNGTLTMSGTGATRDDIAMLMEQLKTIEYVRSVNIPSHSFDPTTEEYAITVTCEYNVEEGEGNEEQSPTQGQ